MTFVLASLLVAIDQLSKFWVVRSLPLNGSEIPLALGFSLTHIRNSGAAFGILRNIDLELGPVTLDGTMLLGVLSAVVSLLLIVYLAFGGRGIQPLARVALAVILAGAAGNMIDRLRLGYVTDFVHFRVSWFDFPVFNVADACVVIGAGLLILAGVRGRPVSAAVTGDPPQRLVSQHAFRRSRLKRLEEFPELPPLGGRSGNHEA